MRAAAWSLCQRGCCSVQGWAVSQPPVATTSDTTLAATAGPCCRAAGDWKRHRQEKEAVV